MRRFATELRADFPIFERLFEGKQVAYLDSAATSQKPRQVIEAVDDFYREHNANIHRSVYKLADEATVAFEGARTTVAEWIGATEKEVIFTKNATESINLVAQSWGRANIEPGDLIVLTQLEHHSNIVPWQLIAQERGATVEYVPVDEAGKLDLAAYSKVLERRPKLVAFAHISNVLGTINPVAEMVRAAHEAGAKTLIDGAQAAPQLKLDMNEIGSDFYVFTGHKLYGPTGIGVLYGRRELLEGMPPFLSGGDMIKKVEWEGSTWNDLPWKFEAGTSPIASVVGLGAAVEWVASVGIDEIRQHELELTAYALEQLNATEKVTVYGPGADERGAVVSFTIEGIHPHDIAQILDRSAVCVRAGHHCAQPLMRLLGVQATARASFGAYNTLEDVDRLVAAIEEAKSIFEV